MNNVVIPSGGWAFLLLYVIIFDRSLNNALSCVRTYVMYVCNVMYVCACMCRLQASTLTLATDF